MFDLNDTYTASETALIADIPASTLQNWLNRGVIVGHGDKIEGGGSQGKHRRFSFWAVMQISVAAALIKASNGMPVKEAFLSAMHFAHSGEGGGGYAGDNEIQDDDPPRDPGFPHHFKLGATLIACADGEAVIVRHRAKNDTYAEIKASLGHAIGFVVIDASEVFNRFCAAIGQHPYEALDAVYPEYAG